MEGGECAKISGSLGISSSLLHFPRTDGRPLPRAVVTLDPDCPQSGPKLSAEMLAGDPSIAVAVAGVRAVYLNPELLCPGEEEVVLQALGAAWLREARPPVGRGIER